MADNYFDPPGTQTLSPEDPLRDWAAQQGIDPMTGSLLIADPSKAIDSMIAKGIAPPPPVMAYSGDRPFAIDAAPPTPPDVIPMPNGGLPVFGPNGKMMGNQTSAQGQVPQAPASVPVTAPMAPVPVPAASAGSDLDPEVNPSAGQPLVPRARPTEAPSTEVGAKKKPELGDALGDFSKSLAGVKPVQPPPVNPVGTPSVRAHTAAGSPNIQALLQMIGQQNSPALSTLGRLLVAGKA